jgi:hypothetical protein
MRTKRKVCFLICPMGDPQSETRQRSIDLRDRIVLPAMRELNFDLEDFLDDQGSRESIRQRMMEFITTADLCVADLTESNPNVFFEYGLRRATGLPVLAFIHEGQKLLYDVDDYYTQPYDLQKTAPAIEAIERFAQRARFGPPTVRVDAERRAQTKMLCDYIVERKPKRVDILQFSMLAMRNDFSQALRKSPDTIVRLLLLHPDYAQKYGSYCTTDVLGGTDMIRNLPETTRTFASPSAPCPTVGLWYYKHAPSAAAVIMDDSFVQLGWYLHEPTAGSERICVKGNDQPSVIARGEDALKLLTPIRNHFSSVLAEAEWVLGVGAGQNDLRAEWERSVAAKRGVA